MQWLCDHLGCIFLFLTFTRQERFAFLSCLWLIGFMILICSIQERMLSLLPHSVECQWLKAASGMVDIHRKQCPKYVFTLCCFSQRLWLFKSTLNNAFKLCKYWSSENKCWKLIANLCWGCGTLTWFVLLTVFMDFYKSHQILSAFSGWPVISKSVPSVLLFINTYLFIFALGSLNWLTHELLPGRSSLQLLYSVLYLAVFLE